MTTVESSPPRRRGRLSESQSAELCSLFQHTRSIPDVWLSGEDSRFFLLGGLSGPGPLVLWVLFKSHEQLGRLAVSLTGFREQ